MRVGKGGEFKDSGPCMDCINMIKKLKIKKIIYSCENNITICKPCDYNIKHYSLGRRMLNINN